MHIFLYAISILWIAAGVCFILYTDDSRQWYRKILDGMDRRIVAILPLVAGILFLASAGHSRNSWVIVLFGILGLAKGVAIFFNPSGLYEKTVEWILETSDHNFRFFGIIALVLGTALFSWII